MAGLNIATTQDSISAYIREQFPNYVVYDDIVLDDDFVIKQGNKVKPYIVLQYGGLNPTNINGSFTSVRRNEYYSTVDVSVVASTPKQAKRGLLAVLDTILGWVPVDSTQLEISSSLDIWGVQDNSGAILTYMASVRFKYQVNTTNIGSYITH